MLFSRTSQKEKEKMTYREALGVLIKMNEWRRDNEKTTEQPCTSEDFGKAIDVGIEAISRAIGEY